MGGLGWIEVHFASLTAGMIETCCDSTATGTKQQAHETHCVFFLIYLDFMFAPKSGHSPGGYVIFLFYN